MINVQCIKFIDRLKKFFDFKIIFEYILLAKEVTPGLLAGVEHDAHQINVMICLKGDQMEENSEQHCVNLETRPGMHERVSS
jgi:hypothetical protein